MSNPVVDKAVQEALSVLKETFPEEYQKLQSDQKEELVALATAVAEGEVHDRPIPSDRVELIKKGLQIPSYRINFRYEKGNYHADITRSAVKYLDSIKLDTSGAFLQISGLQIASIVVEAIGLVLSIIGISVPEEKMAEVAAKVAKTLMESPAIKAAVETLKKVFGNGGSSTKSKAHAVWELLKAVWEYRTHGNIFITIVKALISSLSIWDIVKAVVKITALIVAAVASGGAALVAKIVLALGSAYEFIKKIFNLNELDAIEFEVN